MVSASTLLSRYLNLIYGVVGTGDGTTLTRFAPFDTVTLMKNIATAIQPWGVLFFFVGLVLVGLGMIAGQYFESLATKKGWFIGAAVGMFILANASSIVDTVVSMTGGTTTP
ncbi:MAG: hypothetical protein WCG26_07710 [Chloroflexales bacterium]